MVVPLNSQDPRSHGIHEMDDLCTRKRYQQTDIALHASDNSKTPGTLGTTQQHLMYAL